MAYTYETKQGDLLRVTACTGHNGAHAMITIQNGDKLTIACVEAADAPEVAEQITGYAELSQSWRR